MPTPCPSRTSLALPSTILPTAARPGRFGPAPRTAGYHKRNLSPEEVLFIKCFDSKTDVARKGAAFRV